MNAPWDSKDKQGADGKAGRRKALLAWAFIIIGLAGIILMIVTNPKQKKLVCDENVPHSLNSFGTCQEEAP